MAAATALPNTIFITTLRSVSPNGVYSQCQTGIISPQKIGTKREYSYISSSPTSFSVNSQNSPSSITGNGSQVWIPNAVPSMTYKLETVDDDDYEYDDSDQSQYLDNDQQPPKKRERLTHLTPEEKLFRRKMKNRIAAQTARDRKKALMVDLEETCRRLEEENDALAVENSKLRQGKNSLAEENERLRKLLADKERDEKKNQNSGCHDREDVRTVCAFGPAESISVPLPKEQAKAGWALTWLVASALIQLYSNCCDKSSAEVEDLKFQLEQLKENGGLTLEEVLSRSPPEALAKLSSIIRTYKTMETKPP